MLGGRPFGAVSDTPCPLSKHRLTPVEHSYSVSEPRSPDGDDCGIDTEDDGALEDRQSDILRNDDAHGFAEGMPQLLLQEWGLGETAHEEHDRNVCGGCGWGSAGVGLDVSVMK